MTNWKTTVAGLVLAATTYAQQAGLHVGHIGSTDVIGAISAMAALLLGFYAKDAQNATQNAAQPAK